MQSAEERPDPTLQRKAAIAHGAALDHTGRVAVRTIPGFDLGRTIFQTLEGRLERAVMALRVGKEVDWQDAPAAEVQRAAVHHNLSRDQLFDITNYLKLTWAEYKKLIEDTRKEPLWWYDSARKRIKKTRPAGTLKTNFLTESLFPADLFTMPEYVPKPDEPKDPRNSDVQLPRTRANDEIWAKYDAELQAHLMYLEDIEAIKRMTAARIRDIQQEFFKEQWAVAMEI